MICDNCKQTNKGRYSSFYQEGKVITLCHECRWGTASATVGDKDKKNFEHISTPYWVHMGLKPKPKEKAQMEYMKKHNMSWGDMQKAKNMGAKNPSAYKEFEKFVGGRREDVKYEKR